MKVIKSEQRFAWMMGIPLEQLNRVANNPASHYHEFQQQKKSNPSHVRTIRNPTQELKEIQRRIKDRIFEDVDFGPEVQGGVSGRSPKTNAERHLGARYLVTADVKSFYDNVDHRAVFQMLREFGYGTGVASLITKLTTRNGLLPQGAPTSTVISNLVLHRAVDAPTQAQADMSSTVFGRYIDDISLSGQENPIQMIGDIARRLSSRGLSIHRGAKLIVRPQSMPQTITGLNINSGRPTVPQHYHDRVRAAIHGLSTISDATKQAATVRSIKGRIAHIRRYQPGAAKRLLNQLARALR